MTAKKRRSLIERAVSAPAEALDSTIEAGKAVGHFAEKPFQEAQDYWKRLGPGLTTGAADDDPSGIATYSQAGAQYGFQFLWLSWLTFPLMAVVQEMCARIGIVTGEGLAANIRKHFTKWVLGFCTLLLFIANTLNIGADLGAMAKAVQLLRPSLHFGPLVVGVALLGLLLEVMMPYSTYAKYLKWLALVLLSYVLAAFVIPNLNWSEIAHATFLPRLHFQKDQLILLTGVLGTTISPYLFFWQTSQEVEEDIKAGNTTILERRQSTSVETVKDMRLDVWSGMFLSNLVMFFIIMTCGAVLFRSGVTNIATAADAAAALAPLAGQGAYLLFAVGIIGTGLLAIPVLAGSVAYALSETMGWKSGLNRQVREATAFYGIIIISTGIGLLINFVGLDPIKALIWSAVANGLVAPVILVLIVILAARSSIMGKWVNSRFTTWFGWACVLLMVLSGVGTLWALFT